MAESYRTDCIPSGTVTAAVDVVDGTVLQEILEKPGQEGGRGADHNLDQEGVQRGGSQMVVVQEEHRRELRRGIQQEAVLVEGHTLPRDCSLGHFRLEG